jgi:hypothetical protein
MMSALRGLLRAEISGVLQPVTQSVSVMYGKTRINHISSSPFVSSTLVHWSTGLLSDQDFLSLLTEAVMDCSTSPQCCVILSEVERLILFLLNDHQTSTKTWPMCVPANCEMPEQLTMKLQT